MLNDGHQHSTAAGDCLKDPPVIALYDFRSKQAYIYRTNKLIEIVGASYLITQAYDAFINEAKKNNINIKRNTVFENAKYINTDEPLELFSNSDWDGEVIYIGGGNLYMIYRNEAVFIRANMIFSKMLLDTTYSLRVICAKSRYTGNYTADQKALYKNNMLIKNTEPVTVPGVVLPFTELDRKTSLPVAAKVKYPEEESLSLESVKKRGAYDNVKDSVYKLSEENLDNLVTEKGNESLLAVIYIDGNGLGEEIKNLLGDETDYSICVQKIREFSNNTQESFVTKPLAAIEQKLKDLPEITDSKGNKIKNGYRRIVGGGDEITIICNARTALELVKVYFVSLLSTPNKTACAGIAIFHSHDPFSVVYKIAEECCENGKKMNRKNGNKNCYIDYHFCRSGITNSLEEIRKIQEKKHTNRPFCYLNQSKNTFNEFSRFEEVAAELKKIGRANTKALSDAILRNDSDFIIELKRIKSNYKDLNLTETDKNIIFDVSVVYDIWFAKDGEQNAKD